MRYKINKTRGSAKFRHHAKKTKMINLAPPPMRGGYRL